MTDSAAVPEQPKPRPAHWFKPGQSGNPGGRPVGSRNRINGDFTRDLADLWHRRGKAVLETAADEDPVAFVRMVASLLPKDVQITARPFTDFTDDDLLDAIRRIESHLAAGGSAAGAAATIEGEATRVVPALPEAAGVPRGWEGSPRAAADGGESGGQDPERCG